MMPQIRLLGLALVITSLMLTLAAFITKTSQIRVKRFGSVAPVDATPQVVEGSDEVAEPAAPKIEFISIPVLWPLAAAGCLGMLFWFAGAPRTTKPKPRRRRSRRRSR